MLKLANNKSFLNGGDDELKAGFSDGSIAAGVSGTWNALPIKNALKDNYAATKLPTFTIENKEYQMSSFAGYKLMGVNPHSKNLVWAHKLASWLTNEQNQRLRFNELEIGPTNKKVAESEEVKANIALAALTEQSKYAVTQQFVPTNYWNAVEAFGAGVCKHEIDENNLQEKLNQMVDLIKSISK